MEATSFGKGSSHLSPKKLLLQHMETMTKVHDRPKCREYVTGLRVPTPGLDNYNYNHFTHLRFREPHGRKDRKSVRTWGPGILLPDGFFTTKQKLCSHECSTRWLPVQDLQRPHQLTWQRRWRTNHKAPPLEVFLASNDCWKDSQVFLRLLFRDNIPILGGHDEIRSNQGRTSCTV